MMLLLVSLMLALAGGLFSVGGEEMVLLPIREAEGGVTPIVEVVKWGLVGQPALSVSL